MKRKRKDGSTNVAKCCTWPQILSWSHFAANLHHVFFVQTHIEEKFVEKMIHKQYWFQIRSAKSRPKTRCYHFNNQTKQSVANLPREPPKTCRALIEAKKKSTSFFYKDHNDFLEHQNCPTKNGAGPLDLHFCYRFMQQQLIGAIKNLRQKQRKLQGKCQYLQFLCSSLSSLVFVSIVICFRMSP
jgi:hypothetical protein